MSSTLVPRPPSEQALRTILPPSSPQNGIYNEPRIPLEVNVVPITLSSDGKRYQAPSLTENCTLLTVINSSSGQYTSAFGKEYCRLAKDIVLLMFTSFHPCFGRIITSTEFAFYHLQFLHQQPNMARLLSEILDAVMYNITLVTFKLDEIIACVKWQPSVVREMDYHARMEGLHIENNGDEEEGNSAPKQGTLHTFNPDHGWSGCIRVPSSSTQPIQLFRLKTASEVAEGLKHGNSDALIEVKDWILTLTEENEEFECSYRLRSVETEGKSKGGQKGTDSISTDSGNSDDSNDSDVSGDSDDGKDSNDVDTGRKKRCRSSAVRDGQRNIHIIEFSSKTGRIDKSKPRQEAESYGDDADAEGEDDNVSSGMDSPIDINMTLESDTDSDPASGIDVYEPTTEDEDSEDGDEDEYVPVSRGRGRSSARVSNSKIPHRKQVKKHIQNRRRTSKASSCFISDSNANPRFSNTHLTHASPLNRARHACEECRRRRVKCDETQPACTRCWRLNKNCVWGKPPQYGKMGEKIKSSKT
ncbi:hypothetical protein AYX15_00877 [Cryptococcus neoformans]|nr:hypothetical protein AYX15_00877 [Cryptococcus neoformans var. grubii]